MHTKNNPKAYLLDLGNVIINLKPQDTKDKLQKLLGQKALAADIVFHSTEIFIQFEKGQINQQQLIDGINQKFNLAITPQQFTDAWNAMLGHIPHQRIQIIKQLAISNPVYLLSNTNTTHFNFVNNLLQNQFNTSFTQLFNQVFTSFDIGAVKPDEKIYTFVLNQLKTQAQNITFFDDREENILAAQQMGFNTVHIIPGQYTLEQHFSNL